MRSTLQDYFCELCNAECYGYANFQQHINGKKHKQNLKHGRPDYDQLITSYYCQVCDSMCSRPEGFVGHLEGKKHKRLEKRFRQMLASLSENDATKKRLLAELKKQDELARRLRKTTTVKREKKVHWRVAMARRKARKKANREREEADYLAGIFNKVNVWGYDPKYVIKSDQQDVLNKYYDQLVVGEEESLKRDPLNHEKIEKEFNEMVQGAQKKEKKVSIHNHPDEIVHSMTKAYLATKEHSREQDARLKEELLLRIPKEEYYPKKDDDEQEPGLFGFIHHKKIDDIKRGVDRSLEEALEGLKRVTTEAERRLKSIDERVRVMKKEGS